jgi:NAD(P)-dependent dehydrogenase (short-subunit alcohol dehydrogenase family)
MSVRFDFDGRVTPVTGASGALGSAVVDRLDAAGATVAAVDVVPPEDEDSLLDSDGVTFYRADLTDERAVEETVTRIVDDHGRLDHLLNVAGTWRDGAPVESTPLETYRLSIDVNLTTAFLIINTHCHTCRRPAVPSAPCRHGPRWRVARATVPPGPRRLASGC